MKYSEYLRDIIDYKKEVVAKTRPAYIQMKDKIFLSKYERYSIFKRKISQEGQVNLIAEIKKASPSKGLIRENFDVKWIARQYTDNNTAAISVLTEDKYFLGKPSYIRQLSHDCPVPILAKDFFIDEGQMFEAKFNGASAILLIVAILDDRTLKSFIELAHTIDLDCLVEVHTQDEVKRAVDVGAEIIGINNRNLNTFEVDLNISEKLMADIPKGIIKVAESGIQSYDDVLRLKNCGTNAVLIGETFMRAENIGRKIKEVMYGKS